VRATIHLHDPTSATANDAVAICKAVIVGIAPAARDHGITHQVSRIDRWTVRVSGGGVLITIPAETVFVAVIDPGVGTRAKRLFVQVKDGSVFCSSGQWH